MQPGWMLHSFICVGVATVSFLLSFKMIGKLKRSDKRYLTSVTFGFFWALFGVSYLFFGLSIASEYTSDSGLALAFFYASFASLLMMSAPLSYFIMHILLGDKRVSIATSLGFAIIGLTCIILLFTVGVDMASPDFWIPKYDLDPLLQYLFVFGLYVPSLSMILGLLPFVALRIAPKFTKYKITLSLIALSLVYDFVLLGVLGISGLSRVISSLFILLGALLGYAAFFPPKIAIKVFKLEEKEFEEYVGYEGDGE